MDDQVDSGELGQVVMASGPRLRFLNLVRAPVKGSSLAILRITADVTAYCSGCGEGIEASDLACEVSFEATRQRPDLRFHHRCYRTWCAIEAL
jgi:hypothetical protein